MFLSATFADLPQQLPAAQKLEARSLQLHYSFTCFDCYAPRAPARPQQPLAQLISAADLLGHVLVGHIVALHRAQRLVHTRIEGLAHRGNRAHLQLCRTSSICFTIRLTPERSCSAEPVALSASSKLSSTGRNCSTTLPVTWSRNSTCSRSARLRAFSNSACSARQPIQQLIAFALQLLDLRLDAVLPPGRPHFGHPSWFHRAAATRSRDRSSLAVRISRRVPLLLLTFNSSIS